MQQAWQRRSGGFSGAAKKEYLKWKRQQAAARTDDSSSDEGHAAAESQTVHDGGASTASTGAGATAQQRRQRVSPYSSESAEVTAPLCYRPLVAVPAAPFSMSAQQQSSSTELAGSADVADAHSSQPAATSSSQGSAEPVPAQLTYMPRLNPAEVGFTPEGCTLGMPTRPAWQGVVSSTEELHALEEQGFAAWQAGLAHKAQQLAAAPDSTDAAAAAAAAATSSKARQQANRLQQQEPPPQQQQHEEQQQQLVQGLVAGLGPISPYEGRLEFWRQLWRTLEMSDVICMIVDARNPLLHFSAALHRHITQDHQLPLILLLNKCDLIPAAAAAAWQQWLQQQLPGVTVIPVSAAQDQAGATARQVLQAVLQQQVLRQGQRMPVQELVGLSLDELMQESVLRNTHAKRHLEALAQQQQQQRGTNSSRLKEHAASAAAANASTASSGKDSDWSTGVNRGASKAGRKVRRRRQQHQQRQHQQQLAEPSSVSASDTDGAGRLGDDCDGVELEQEQQQQGQEQQGQKQEQGQQHGQEQRGQQEQREPEVDEMLASLTLERRLSSTTSSCSHDIGLTASHAIPQPAPAISAAAAAAGRRPVVVGMLGEPNVGKSSALNALLGAHRVAVSSHPGRTKHYQTLYMCDALVLVDCPGIVFPRLNVSPAMQVLFGSSPIASCRQPYAVVRYLAEASWPRVQDTLRLQLVPDTPQATLPLGGVGGQQQHANAAEALLHLQQQQAQDPGSLADNSSSGSGMAHDSSSGDSNPTAAQAAAAAGVLAGGPDNGGWSPWVLCEALATKRHWVLPRSGRLDTYRAANWLLRAALAGQQGTGLAFLPPAAGTAAAGAAP